MKRLEHTNDQVAEETAANYAQLYDDGTIGIRQSIFESWDVRLTPDEVFKYVKELFAGQHREGTTPKEAMDFAAYLTDLAWLSVRLFGKE